MLHHARRNCRDRHFRAEKFTFSVYGGRADCCCGICNYIYAASAANDAWDSSCRMLPGRPDHVQIPRSPALEWKSRCSECDCNHCPAFNSIWGLFYFRPIRLSYGIPRFMQSCPECISSGRGLLVRDVSLWLPAATSIHRFGFLDASLVVKHDRGLSDLFRFRSVFMVVHRKAGSKS